MFGRGTARWAFAATSFFSLGPVSQIKARCNVELIFQKKGPFGSFIQLVDGIKWYCGR